MSPTLTRLLLASLLAVAAPAWAQPVAMEQRLLERGAVADVTPQQRHRTAINEAGGGYKLWLTECATMTSSERTSCRRDAKAAYDRDMAAARAILRR